MSDTTEEPLRAHKVMTPEEYATMPLRGWHMVCRDVDGSGGIGVRYLGAWPLVSSPRQQQEGKP